MFHSKQMTNCKKIKSSEIVYVHTVKKKQFPVKQSDLCYNHLKVRSKPFHLCMKLKHTEIRINISHEKINVKDENHKSDTDIRKENLSHTCSIILCLNET